MENTYEKITALVPNGEHFDSTAINEGVYLTEGHLANIEVSLKNQDTVVGEMQNQLDAEKAAVAAHQATITERDATITAQATEIETLKSEVADLKKKPAGDFKATAKPADDHGGGEGAVESEATRQNKKNRAMAGLPVNF